MHDTLNAAREQARQWREAKGDEAAGGVVLILDGYFVGWVAELPPAELWAAGCLGIAGDGHAWLIDRPSWREPLQWFDLEPSPEPEAPADPPPSPPESGPSTETPTSHDS